MPKKKKKPRSPGRPKGSIIPIERDGQKYAIAIWHGLTMSGTGPYLAAYWALVVTSDAPIMPAAVESLLNVASTEIKFTASSLDKHVDHLVRKARDTPLEESAWLRASAIAIKFAVLAVRNHQTEMYCAMVDYLIGLDWRPLLSRLVERIDDLAKSNVPPLEGELSRRGRAALEELRKKAKKPQ
jgi:hypothetical protein